MYRTVAQLDSVSSILSGFFPQLVSRFALPERSVQGREVFAMRLRAGADGSRRGVLLLAGTHSRELMNPDCLVELAIDLVVSYLNGTDIVLGARRWPANDIKVLLETLDLYLVPCINPDGREYVMTVDDLWRKNRRDNPGTTCDGVDLNRNLDILWGVTQGQTSCSPCSDVYAGPAVFSEPETRNVRWLLDTYRIDCFADVHSYSELVLYPWDHAPTQTSDPAQRFTTLPSGTCQPIQQVGYQEYMPPRDLQRYTTVAGRIVDAIAAVRGRRYTPQASVALYPTTGTHSDYAYARHIADPAKRKVYGYTLETGPYTGDPRTSFHPADPEPIKDETESGLLALAQQCICAIELIGSRLLERDDEVTRLRRVRDDLLATTESGRDWIALFERVQTSLITLVLEEEDTARRAAALVQRAAALLSDDTAVLGAGEADEASYVIRSLADRSGSRSIQRDLRDVLDRLDQSRGQTSQAIVEGLIHRGPREPVG
jgi:murein tripeptide amidase MpaA